MITRLRISTAASMTVASAACAFFACTSFGDAPTDPSDPNDGGASSSSDGAAVDGAPSDSAADAGPSFCTLLGEAATSCVDFDNGILPPPWTREEKGGGAARLVADCGPGRSTGCLEVEAKYSAGFPAGEYGAALRFPVGGAPRSALVSAAVRVGEISGGTSDVLAIAMGNSGAQLFWLLELEVAQDGRSWLTEHSFTPAGTDVSTVEASSKLPLEAWTRVDIALAINVTSSSAVLRFDGADVAQKSLGAHAYPEFHYVELGDRYLDPGVATRLRYDEVVVRITP